MNDHRLRDRESHEALLATMGLEPVGSWWLPGIRTSATAGRLLASAEASGEATAEPAAAAALVLGGGSEFLLAFAGPHAPRGPMGNAWRQVRITAADPVTALAGILRGTDPDPRGLLVAATDGESVSGTVTGPGAPRLLALTGAGARVEAAAGAAARESAEEAAAAWARFLAEPGPGAAVLTGWESGLTSNPGTPERAGLLLRQELPADLVEAALEDADPQVRLRAAESHPNLTPAHWARLIRGAGTENERWLLVRRAAARRDPLDEETRALLVADPSARVRAGAARLPGLPAHQAVALAEDPDAGVRAQVCRSTWSALPAAHRRALLADGAAAVRTAARLRHHEDRPLSREVFAREALGETAAETCLPAPDLVEHLLATGEAPLRRALAGNPHLDARAVARLAGDADEGVRRTVSVRPDLTEEQRAAIRVHIDPSDMSVTLPWVARLHEDEEAMRGLAASSHLLVRRSVARARRLPPDVVRRLSRDPDPVVQLFLAESCEDAPAEMLLRVWTWWTGSLSSPGRPRTHPNFPRADLLRYADDPHGRMRRLALDDPRSTPELVARFARDRDPEVRYRAAEDPRLALADAVRLTEDPDDSVRAVALRQQRLPAGVLTARLRDPGAAREAAANPGIPPHVIDAMVARILAYAAARTRV